MHGPPRWRPAFALCLAVLALLAAPALAAAADRYVAPTGDNTSNTCLVAANPCRTIAHAIDNSPDGDTINLAAGTYVEQVGVPRTLSFVGHGDPVWRSPGATEAMSVDADGVSVSGITFGTPGGGTPVAGSIGISTSGNTRNLTVESSTFTGLELGLELTTGDTDASLHANTFEGNGLAVSLREASFTQVLENVSTGDGAFLQTRATTNVTVSSNRIAGATGDAVTASADESLMLDGNTISGDGDAIHVLGVDGPSSQLQIQSNDLAHLGGSAIEFDDSSVGAWLEVIRNRFADTDAAGILAGFDNGTIQAENNWWGCNAGPNTPGCDDYATHFGSAVDADPWTVMTLGADPTTIPAGGSATSEITASFTTNSDLDSISPAGMPDRVPVDLVASLGDIDSPVLTDAGIAHGDLTPGDTAGTSHVTATLDGQSLTIDVVFTPLSVTPTFTTFDTRLAGTGSPARPFTITNTQAVPLRIDGVTLAGDNPADFTAFVHGCAGRTLAPAESCQVSAAFRPISAGDKAALLRVSSSGENTDISLYGIANTPTPLQISPALRGFGDLLVNTGSAAATFIVRNASTTRVRIQNVGLTGADAASFVLFGGECAGLPLPPGGSCAVSVSFRPTSVGSKAAALSVSTSTTPAQSVPLTGTGVGEPTLTISPSARDFGAWGTGSASPVQTFELTNDSATTPILVSSVALAGPGAGDFIGYLGGCAKTVLEPGVSCSVSARFRPLSAGAKTAQLKVTWSGGPTQFIDLSGQGVAR